MPTLQHCTPVKIWESQSSEDFALTIAVGGTAGDGVVEITTDGTGSTVVHTGAGGTFGISGATYVQLHFQSGDPAGVPSIHVTFSED